MWENYIVRRVRNCCTMDNMAILSKLVLSMVVQWKVPCLFACCEEYLCRCRPSEEPFTSVEANKEAAHVCRCDAK